MGFKDHFSGHAALYSSYRPDYPEALYAFLAESSPARSLAWDCATGSGQAALGLARHFDRVIATDASSEQIDNAQVAANIDYRVAPAEASSLEAHSVDLITVAQALHWFDLDAFYAEVQRVLKPSGVLAVWSYSFLQCTPEIDELLYRFYSEVVGPYWPPERLHIERHYSDLPFPYEQEPSPHFAMQTEWTQPQLLGYLRTWSATQRYLQEQGNDPVTLIEKELSELWGGEANARPITWPLTLLWGRKKSS